MTNGTSRTLCLALLAALLILTSAPARAEILLAPNAGETELYAAREFQRYFHQLTGTLLPVARAQQPAAGPGTDLLCLIGIPKDWPLLQKLASSSQIPWSAQNPGPQGYVLKTVTLDDRPALVIAGADPIGCLYGVYGLLADHFGASFHFDGDVLPPRKPVPSSWPVLDEVKTPAVAIRGVLPWTNFPQSPSSYSWEDWRFIIDQMARLRMNFLLIHNYNFDGGNEMFHNFEINGRLSRSWFPTARLGHAWGGMPGWEVSRYRFGATDLFDDYDFGADAGLHNAALDNRQVFRKGVAQFRRVLDYAHRRGVKIGLGLDLDIIPGSYQLTPDDPAVIEARIRQVTQDYPQLDYLMCFFAEGEDPVRRAKWRIIFDGMYAYAKKHAPQIKVAVSGWGLPPKDVATLPKDVVCAPIAAYSDKCETGAVYGNREYWGCPWLERDFVSSEYYYPYNLHLSNTVQAWGERAANMKGFICLTWRLTDAISPKLGFIARAPWDTQGELKDAATVYRQFAEQHYGAKAAPAITAIINQNEPFATDFGECQETFPFAIPNRPAALFNLYSVKFSGDGAPDMTLAAADYKEQRGVQNAPSTLGGQSVAWIDAGDWTAYHTWPKLDFNPKWTSMTLKTASAAQGGKIEIHLDAPDGKKIGEALVPATGDWNAWTDVKAKIAPTKGQYAIYLVYASREPNDQIAKAESQLKTIDACIAEAEFTAQKARLGLLRNRIAAARDHILLNLNFKEYGEADLAAVMCSWVRNFTGRVTDISSLGNVASVQDRFVQKNFLPREAALRLNHAARPPLEVAARGTRDGARITWKNAQPEVRGFVVYRDGWQKATPAPLPPTATEFVDTAQGDVKYTVAALRWDEQESPQSLPYPCQAGAADRTPPQIVVISPPTSAFAGQPVAVKARLLDNRGYELLSATLCYRKPGAPEWTRLPMARRVKAVFAAQLPAAAVTEDGLEYYVEATDGDNTACFPVSAPSEPLSLTVEPLIVKGAASTADAAGAAGTLGAAPAPVKLVAKESKPLSLAWEAVPGAVLYQVYRSEKEGFEPGPENALTFVAADAELSFTDHGEDLWARPLRGPWRYRVVAVDKQGNEGQPSPEATITFEP